MVRCPDCGILVAASMRYCTSCGAHLIDAETNRPRKGPPSAPELSSPQTLRQTLDVPGTAKGGAAAPARTTAVRARKFSRTLNGFAMPTDQTPVPPRMGGMGSAPAQPPRPTLPSYGGMRPVPFGAEPIRPMPTLDVTSEPAPVTQAAEILPNRAEPAPPAAASVSTVPPPRAEAGPPPAPREVPDGLSRFFYYPDQILRGESGGEEPPEADERDPHGRPVGGAAHSRSSRRRSTRRRIAILVAVGLLALGSALVWAGRRPPELGLRIHWDANGQQVLKLSCADCRDGSTAKLNGRTVTLAGGAGQVTMDPPFPVGETPLSVTVQTPDGVEQPPMTTAVWVPFQLAPDRLALAQGTPVLRWIVQVTPGVRVQIDRKPVATKADGTAVYDLDLSSQCSGNSAEKAVIGRTIHFTAYRGSQVVDEGDQTVTAAVVPLEVTSASVTGQSNQILLKGHTAEGASVVVDGNSISVGDGGWFEQPISVGLSRNVTVLARASGHLTRTVRLSLRDDGRSPARRSDPAEPTSQRPAVVSP